MTSDAVGDHAPDLTAIIADGQGGEVWVLCRELPSFALSLKPFDREFTMDDGNHDVVRLRGDAAVYDQQC